jgi:hypothetical protein
VVKTEIFMSELMIRQMWNREIILTHR